MRGIPAAHIEVGIRLGKAFVLGLLQRIGIAEAGLAHAGEDVIARPVDDAVDGADVVPHEAFLQHLDDRNTARHRRLEVNRHAALLGERKEFLPALCEEGLVTRDDDLFRLQCCANHVVGRGGPADQFDDHRNGRIVDEFLPVHGQNRPRDLHIALPLQIANDHASHADVRPGAFGDEGAVLLQVLKHTRADISKSGEADLDDAGRTGF